MSRRTKRNGQIEPSPVHKLVDHVVENVFAGDKQMTLTVYTYDWSIDMFIGSKSIYCAKAHLSKRSDGVVKNTVFIDKIRWDAECSYDAEFERGKDTTMIFKLIISYINDHYPTVQYAEFNDVSNRRCDNGGWVNLAAMKLFTDGQTWYESHFGATIDQRFKEVYHTIVADANHTKKAMTWEDAKKEMPWNMLDIAEDTLKEKYETTEIWREWFKWIRAKKGDSAFCIWLSYKGWFDEFLRSVLKFNIMNYIFTVDISNEKLHIPYQLKKGGSRRRDITQKKRRILNF